MHMHFELWLVAKMIGLAIKHLEIGYMKFLRHSFNCGVMHNSGNVLVVEELATFFFFFKFIISSISQDDDKEFF
jgi:hypothetical protein